MEGVSSVEGNNRQLAGGNSGFMCVKYTWLPKIQVASLLEKLPRTETSQIISDSLTAQKLVS